jgi:hypothetical protein
VRNFLQHFVTDDASVIDAFEMVDIAEQKSQSGFFAIGADELAMDKIHDDDAIPKRSEMVVSSLKRICSSAPASSSAKLTSGIEVCSFRDIHTGQFFSGSSNPAN